MKEFYMLVVFLTLLQCSLITSDYRVECSTLRMGQFICPDPDPEYNYIDPKTQQPYGCTKENKAKGNIKLNIIDIIFG